MRDSQSGPSHSPLPSNNHKLDSDEDSDFEDLTVIEGSAHDVLAGDPLNRSTTNGTSSSNSRNPFGLSLPTHHNTTDIADGPPTPLTPATPSPGANLRRRHTPVSDAGERSNYFGNGDALDGSVDGNARFQDDKEPGSSTDWYQEGPGRRVGYEDLTAIDWIFEYAKERQRLRVLISSTAGAVGQLRRLLDASQIWIILVLTGIVTGVIAAWIDVVSDWLGDVKQGVCKGGAGGGKFYLNKTFCCWGLDGMCMKMKWWRQQEVLTRDRIGAMQWLDVLESSAGYRICWRRLYCGIYLFHHVFCKSLDC